MADAFVTLWGLGTGAFTEQNPLARAIIVISPFLFLATKLTSLSIFLWVAPKLHPDLKHSMFIILLGGYSIVLSMNAYTILSAMFHA